MCTRTPLFTPARNWLFVSKGTIDDEDEVMAVMAEELPSLLPHLGGDRFADSLLPLLEELASNEEAVIRDKVCLSQGERSREREVERGRERG